MDAMNFRIKENFIFDDECKFMWHINIIKNDDSVGWNVEQRESKNKITKWLQQNYPELLL